MDPPKTSCREHDDYGAWTEHGARVSTSRSSASNVAAGAAAGALLFGEAASFATVGAGIATAIGAPVAMPVVGLAGLTLGAASLLQFTCKSDNKYSYTSLSFIHGDRLVAGTREGQVVKFDWQGEEKQLRECQGQTVPACRNIAGVDVAPCGSRLFVTMPQGLQLWIEDNGNPLKWKDMFIPQMQRKALVGQVAVSPEGVVAALSRDGGTVATWLPVTLSRPHIHLRWDPQSRSYRGMADGRRERSVGPSSVTWISSALGPVMLNQRPGMGAPWSMAWGNLGGGGANNSCLAVSCDEGLVLLDVTSTGGVHVRRCSDGYNGAKAEACAWSPGSDRWLACSSPFGKKGGVVLFRTTDWEHCVHQLPDGMAARRLAWAHDGALLAAATQENIYVLGPRAVWLQQEGCELLLLHRVGVQDIVWGPRFFAAGYDNGELKVYPMDQAAAKDMGRAGTSEQEATAVLELVAGLDRLRHAEHYYTADTIQVLEIMKPLLPGIVDDMEKLDTQQFQDLKLDLELPGSSVIGHCHQTMASRSALLPKPDEKPSSLLARNGAGEQATGASSDSGVLVSHTTAVMTAETQPPTPSRLNAAKNQRPGWNDFFDEDLCRHLKCFLRDVSQEVAKLGENSSGLSAGNSREPHVSFLAGLLKTMIPSRVDFLVKMLASECAKADYLEDYGRQEVESPETILETVLEGHLQRKGKLAPSLLPAYFVIVNRCIMRYSSKSDRGVKKPDAIIQAHEIREVYIPDDNSSRQAESRQPESGREFRFIIWPISSVARKRCWKLVVRTKAERRQWMDAIEQLAIDCAGRAQVARDGLAVRVPDGSQMQVTSLGDEDAAPDDDPSAAVYDDGVTAEGSCGDPRAALQGSIASRDQRLDNMSPAVASASSWASSQDDDGEANDEDAMEDAQRANSVDLAALHGAFVEREEEHSHNSAPRPRIISSEPGNEDQQQTFGPTAAAAALGGSCVAPVDPIINPATSMHADQAVSPPLPSEVVLPSSGFLATVAHPAALDPISQAPISSSRTICIVDEGAQAVVPSMPVGVASSMADGSMPSLLMPMLATADECPLPAAIDSAAASTVLTRSTPAVANWPAPADGVFPYAKQHDGR